MTPKEIYAVFDRVAPPLHFMIAPREWQRCCDDMQELIERIKKSSYSEGHCVGWSDAMTEEVKPLEETVKQLKADLEKLRSK